MRLCKAILALVACGWIMASAAQVQRPRLVVGIVVDQMRWDYLYYYGSQWGEGGFRRLMSEGYLCNNTQVDYVPTVTACGHASIFTGTTPAYHGIAGNNYMLGGREVASVDDSTATGLGTSTEAGQQSPRNLLTTTIGDELKLATRFQSRVVGVALKGRAAILPAGHAADAAYWFDKSVPAFVSSTYYMPKLPGWVTRYNARHRKELSQELWQSWRGVRETFNMGKAIVTNEHLGQGTATDMLTLSVSTTDMTAHRFGTRSPQTDSCYLELDRQLALFLAFLDQQVGRGNYLLFLSADHGGTNNYQYSDEHRLPTGAWDYWNMTKGYNQVLEQQFGVAGLIKADMEFSVYLDNEKIAAAHLNRDSVKLAVMRLLGSDPRVQSVVDMEHVATAPIPESLKQRLIKGYCPGRSGEIHVNLRAGCYAGSRDEAGSNHGTWSNDDSHIPLIFMGWGIKPGETAQPVNMTDIAPTVCALLHIEQPSGSIGRPVPGLVP